MDDFYAECQEKLNNTNDPVAAVGELMGISLQDFPSVQLCQFSEQLVTLLSVTSQSTAYPTEELLAKFQAIHQQLERTLVFMEQVIATKVEFPGPPPKLDSYWV